MQAALSPRGQQRRSGCLGRHRHPHHLLHRRHLPSFHRHPAKDEHRVVLHQQKWRCLSWTARLLGVRANLECRLAWNQIDLYVLPFDCLSCSGVLEPMLTWSVI